MTSKMSVTVQCGSGREGQARPIRFQLNGRDCLVEEVVDQWYGSDDLFFKVRADDGNLYILRRKQNTTEWSLESFRLLH